MGQPWAQHAPQQPELEDPELWLLSAQQQQQPRLPCRRRLTGKQQQAAELTPQQPESPQQPKPQQDEASGTGVGHELFASCEEPLEKSLPLCWEVIVTENLEEKQLFTWEHYFFPTRGF